MNNFNFLNNFADAVCVFSEEKIPVFKNRQFNLSFPFFSSIEKFKKYFNFNICFLSSEYINKVTPIDIILNSEENSHTICSYQKQNGDLLYYYVYSFKLNNYKVVIFKDITLEESYKNINTKYIYLSDKYEQIQETAEKYSKLQEHSQSQVLKMGIINRISLVIRETNDMEKIISFALNEINELLGSFKTYFSMKEHSGFRITYSINENNNINTLTKYEDNLVKQIRNKDIIISSCLKEYLNAETFLPEGVKRIIIPVYNNNKLLGIIVTLTKQRMSIKENREILQSISVQLASSIMQAGLISQLNKKNKRLQKALNDLKEMQLQLINSEKMATLGQLISGVAHEINTPLASMSSNNSLICKLIKNKTSLNNNEIDILQELNNIDSEALLRISDIVKSLKRFVRLDEAEFQSADINKELDLTLKLVAHETKNKITIIKNYSEIPPVYCSVNMLNQVFMNIIVNACHSIINNDGKIKITTLSDDKNLIVKIKDNGTGIPLEIQPNIFNVGFTTKKKGVGTGFGLSISKKIIEIHKGTISFNSTPGEGTEFIITIPLRHD